MGAWNAESQRMNFRVSLFRTIGFVEVGAAGEILELHVEAP